ncbi:MAG: GAF domain-containing protein [Chitinophagaceae bacterium]|nr:GAF domain-containing protein [Chitinophagaceae bacterium]
MKIANLPWNEVQRLAELDACQILDTPVESSFNELVELLSQVTGCSHVAITFIDNKRQWFKASIGLDVPESPRDTSFCSHTILDRRVMVVPDARVDERFADNPMVTDGLRIRFYAGAPIVSSNGYNIGTVCAFDTELKNFTPDQERAITIIAGQVTRLLELRLRNQAIREKAEQLIDMERSTLQFALQQQEIERKAIGVELHENFAQVLAASLMYLSVAMEEKELAPPLLLKTRTALEDLLQEMRRLSRTYNPISLPAVTLEEVLRELIVQFAKKAPFDVELDWEESPAMLSDETAINLYRILAQYLVLLEKREIRGPVHIRVLVDQDIQLVLLHSDKHPLDSDRQHQISLNAIITRIRLLRGHYEINIDPSGTTSFIVTMPLSAKETMC